MSSLAIPTSRTKLSISRVTVGRVISGFAVLFLVFDTSSSSHTTPPSRIP